MNAKHIRERGGATPSTPRRHLPQVLVAGARNFCAGGHNVLRPLRVLGQAGAVRKLLEGLRAVVSSDWRRESATATYKNRPCGRTPHGQPHRAAGRGELKSAVDLLTGRGDSPSSHARADRREQHRVRIHDAGFGEGHGELPQLRIAGALLHEAGMRRTGYEAAGGGATSFRSARRE